MRRKAQGSSFTSHSDVLVTEDRGKINSEVRISEIKAEVSQDPGTKILYVIIVASQGILRRIVTYSRNK